MVSRRKRVSKHVPFIAFRFGLFVSFRAVVVACYCQCVVCVWRYWWCRFAVRPLLLGVCWNM
ncbi:Protein of unknown function [Gryllus bimaculatus]|nr:Protein of unknown function [Gryllus bimaculatus]